MSRPRRVRLTAHAGRQLERRRLELDQVEALVLDGHDRRRRNQGQADWRVMEGRIVVLYDWPADGDETLALIRSAWRR